jgi:hypothetical protein
MLDRVGTEQEVWNREVHRQRCMMQPDENDLRLAVDLARRRACGQVAGHTPAWLQPVVDRAKRASGQVRAQAAIAMLAETNDWRSFVTAIAVATYRVLQTDWLEPVLALLQGCSSRKDYGIAILCSTGAPIEDGALLDLMVRSALHQDAVAPFGQPGVFHYAESQRDDFDGPQGHEQRKAAVLKIAGMAGILASATEWQWVEQTREPLIFAHQNTGLKWDVHSLLASGWASFAGTSAPWLDLLKFWLLLACQPESGVLSDLSLPAELTGGAIIRWADEFCRDLEADREAGCRVENMSLQCEKNAVILRWYGQQRIRGQTSEGYVQITVMFAGEGPDGPLQGARLEWSSATGKPSPLFSWLGLESLVGRAQATGIYSSDE